MLRYIYYICLVGAVCQTLWYLPELPSVISSSFNSDGNATGWTSKTTYLALYGLILAVSHSIFIFLPDMFKNDNGIFYFVPNGSSWQAKGKKAETSRYIIQSFTLFGIATLIYLAAYIHIIFAANKLEEPAITGAGTFPFTIGYIVFAIIWFFAFFNRFGSGRLSEANE